MLGLLYFTAISGTPQRKSRNKHTSASYDHMLNTTVTVWNPHTKKDIARVENIQRRAARFVHHNYHRSDSVSSMIAALEWQSLEQRRQAASLTMMYKIRLNLVAINPAHLPLLPTNTRAYHLNKYQSITSLTQLYGSSFFPRTVLLWNTLPGYVLTAPSLEAFRGGVAACL